MTETIPNTPGELPVPATDEPLAPTCPRCEYDLRALPPGTARCPECGLPIDPGRTPESQVAWAHRRRIGAVSAYLRTVVMVSVRSDRFVAQLGRPVERRDGRSFWLVTLALLMPPVVFLAVVGEVFDSKTVDAAARAVAEGKATWEAWVTPALFGLQPAAVRVVCAVACLVAVTSPPIPLYRTRPLPPELDHRLASLGYYACAPLVLVALACAAFVLAALLVPGDRFLVTALWLVASLVAVLSVVAWWWVQVRLMHRATGSAWRATRFAVLLPVFWFSLAFVFLFAVPWVVGYCEILLANLS